MSVLVDPAETLRAALELAPGSTESVDALRGCAARWPGWDEAALRLAEALRRAGDGAGAAAGYRSVLARNPARREAWLALGAMRLAAGDAAGAMQPLREARRLAPDDAQAAHALGMALLALDEPAEAFDVLCDGWRLDPDNALCGVHLADAAARLDRVAEVVRGMRAGRRAAPDRVAVLVAGAAALGHDGAKEEALDWLEAAHLLVPDDLVAASLFAERVTGTMRQHDAAEAWRAVLALAPDELQASLALSVVLMRLHRHGEALALLEAQRARHPEQPAVLCNLATALTSLGRQDEAVACAERAVAMAPHLAGPRRALCNALPYASDAHAAALRSAAEACAARQPGGALLPAWRPPEVERRLRLGLLSGTLRTHPVGWLTVAGFEWLDAARFEIVCLAPNPPGDALGRRFAALGRWEDTNGLDDAALAQRARALGIDVLIDLGGHGDLGRLPALAQRLAPVQVKWVGMQNATTGMPAVDWFLTDRWESPPGDEVHYTERLLRMPDGYVCYSPPDYAPPVADPPGLRTGICTFGCFNNLAKITPRVVASWARILCAVPQSRLVLKTHQFNDAAICAALLERFEAAGVARARIELRGGSAHAELLRQYGDVDLVLDPFPYCGGLTTCEALWMGVPVLTLRGDFFAARHSTSHLCNLGLDEFVTDDEAAYEARAVALGGDLAQLAALRAGLRPLMARSRLTDAPHFGAALGDALRDAWRDWCTRQRAGCMDGPYRVLQD